jgi:putative membrane protein
MAGRFRPFDEAALSRIAEAVRAAEAKSHGEIVPVVVERCEAYPEAQERGGVAGALIASAVLLGFPHALPLWGVVLVQIAAYAVGYAVATFDPIARALIGRATLARAARWRAEIAFREYGLVNTVGGTGVLVFAALFEHQVVVLGDQPVIEKVGLGGFQAIVDRMIGRIGEDRATDGFVEAIDAVGEHLAQHFPPSPGYEKNELPDHLRT